MSLNISSVFRCLARSLAAGAILLSLAMAGCVQQTAMPGTARAGDTIVLGVGGIKRNSGDDQFFTIDDIQQITITDANNQTYAVSADYVYKAFPSNRSWLNSLAIEGASPTVPFDGGWFVVLTLIDINTSLPLPLAVGQAHVAIVSSKLVNTQHSLEGDHTAIPVEIIAGQGSPNNPAFLEQFKVYMEMPGLVVKPGNFNGIQSVAGLQLTINFTQTSAYRSDLNPMVVPIGSHPYIQLAQRTVSLGGNSKAINVILTTQKEFSNTSSADSPSLQDLNLGILYFVPENTSVTYQQLLQDFSIDADKSYYVDKFGNKIAGLVPALSIK